MTDPRLEQIQRWVEAGGRCRSHLIREGIAVDLITCSGGDVVETLTLPRTLQDEVEAMVRSASS